MHNLLYYLFLLREKEKKLGENINNNIYFKFKRNNNIVILNCMFINLFTMQDKHFNVLELCKH